MSSGEDEWEMCGRAAAEVRSVHVHMSVQMRHWGWSVSLLGELRFVCVTLCSIAHTHVTALILCALMLVMGVISTGIIHTSHCEHSQALYYLST